MTIFGAANLPAGPHTVSAQVHGPGGGQSVNIGPNYPSWLIAIPMPNGIEHDRRPSMEQTLSGTTADVGIPPLALQSLGGDHLFILNAADNWSSTPASWVNFMLSVDGDQLAGGVHSGEQEQRLPISIVGVKSLTAGSHSVTAQWGNDPTQTAYQGASYPTRLFGM